MPWGAAEDREVHPTAEKHFEIDPEFKDQVCSQITLQLGKPETRRRETPDQGHPSREKSEPGFSPWRWACGCALLGGTDHAPGAEARALTVLARGSRLRGKLESSLPQFPQHYLQWRMGDEAAGPTRGR